MTTSFDEILDRKKKPIHFHATMGLFSATVLGMGAIMGAGIYVLLGLAVAKAGNGAWLTYLLCGGLAYLSVLLYAELSKLVTVSGGGYTYAYRLLGALWGFMTGWHLALGSIFACAIYALGFAIYTVNIFIDKPVPWLYRTIAIAFTLALTFYNSYRSGGGTLLSQVLTLGNAAALMVLILLALPAASPDRLLPLGGEGPGAILGAISIIYMSFFGYQLIANNSEEIVNPERTVPRAMHLSLLISWGFYLGIVLVSLMAVDWQAIAASPAPLALVAQQSAGRWGWWLVTSGGLLASGAALNSTLLSQSRQIYAMGRDRLLPRWIGQLDLVKHMPVTAIWVGGILVSLTIAIWDIETIARMANFCFLVSMLPISFALSRLQNQKIANGDSIPWFRRIIPWTALVANIALLLTLGLKNLLLSNQIVFLGLIVYIIYSRTREIRGQTGMSVALVEEEPFELDIFPTSRILVPMANPVTQKPLLALGESLLLHENKPDASIVALSVVVAPAEVDFYAALESSSEQALKVLSTGADMLEDKNMDFRPVVRISRSLPLGVVHAAKDEKCPLIIMGFSQNPGSEQKSVMEEVLSKSSSDIIVLRHHHEIFQPRRIAVALGGRPDNLNLMLRLAAALADRYGGEITFLSILPLNYTDKQRLSTDRILVRAIQKNTSQGLYRAEMVTSADPLETLVRRSTHFDLIIGGTIRSSLIGAPVFGNFSLQLARRAECSVALVYTAPPAKKMLPS